MPSMFVRFWGKVQEDPTSGCWVWTGILDPQGYGRFQISERQPMYAHRYSYRQLVGPIPSWLELDHLCRNRSCVNPAHLEAVTHKENTERGIGTAIHIQRSKTHCPQGHLYNTRNTYLNGGKRYCRVCNLERVRRRRKKARESSTVGEIVEALDRSRLMDVDCSYKLISRRGDW